MAMVRLAEYAEKGADGRFAAVANHPLIQRVSMHGQSISVILRKDDCVVVVVDGFPLQFESNDPAELDLMVAFFNQIYIRFRA